MKTTIELEQDQLNEIVRADLRCLMECLQMDLEQVLTNQKGYVFTTDTWQEDAKEIKKHIKAFKRVLKYYGEDL